RASGLVEFCPIARRAVGGRVSCGGHRSGSNPVLATAPERAELLVFEGYGPWSAVTPARARFPFTPGVRGGRPPPRRSPPGRPREHGGPPCRYRRARAPRCAPSP